jgi:hypothetical protein
MYVCFVFCSPLPMTFQQFEDCNDLKFHSKADMESFLLSVQRALSASLAPIKREYITFVRELASQSRAALFESLRSQIQTSIEGATEVELVGEITDRLDSYGEDTEILLLSSIKKRGLYTIVSNPHSFSTAHHAIRNLIVRLVLRPTSRNNHKDIKGIGVDISDGGIGLSGDVSDAHESELARDIDKLGFMLRAPISVLATVPLLLSPGVWRFVHQVSKYYRFFALVEW